MVKCLMTVAAISIVVATGCDDRQERQAAATVATSDPAATFAPLVRLAGREQLWPVSTSGFLRHASLEWSGGPCAVEQDITVSASWRGFTPPSNEPPWLDAGRLGHGSTYRFRPFAGDCSTRRPYTYSSDQHTRPFDTADRPVGLRVDEGFNLDVVSEFLSGRRRLGSDGSLAVPAYYARDAIAFNGQPGIRLSYWLLFGAEQPIPPAPDLSDIREGDWERVDVLAVRRARAGRYRPFAVEYHSGASTHRVKWNDVELAGPGGTHPVAYLDAISHTPRAAGDCNRCTDWKTWHKLRDVRDEPWWGYGGGWGAIGDSHATSGSLGPSPYELGPSP